MKTAAVTATKSTNPAHRTHRTNTSRGKAKPTTPKDPAPSAKDKAAELSTLRSKITQKHLQRLSTIEDGSTDAFNENRRANELHVDIKGDSARVMHLTELLYGHKDADINFVEKVISRLESLPQEEKPDVMVVSGLIFGSFNHRKKNNRRAKTTSIDNQLAKAKELIERLQKMGMTVIYNKSDNDQEIIEDYTYDAVRIVESIAKEGVKASKKGDSGDDWPTSWATFDKVKQSKLWMENFNFQWDVVFEYMLRSGRRLYTAEEVRSKAEAKGISGKVRQEGSMVDGIDTEEYLLLLDAHERLENGENLSALQQAILEVKNIPYSKRPQDNLIVTDDYNLELATKGKTTALHGRHEIKQTPTGMVQDPTKIARDIVNQMHASGQNAPNVLVLENQQQSVGMIEGGTLITSTPGLTGFNHNSSSYTRVVSDKAERIARARGEVNFPGVQQMEFHDDGRISIHLMNDHLLNIASKTNEPHAAIFFSDWQTGSVTARPDLAVKAMDYALHSVLPKRKGMLFLNGDIIQGRNYPEMPNENVSMGLVKIEDQQVFVFNMLNEILEKMPKKARENLQAVHITPGNHEWNSSHKDTGTNHSVFLQVAFSNVSGGHYKTTLHSNGIVLAGPEHFRSSTAIDVLAEYKVLAQHIMMERGGKGSGGLPINQFLQMNKSSSGTLMKEVDLMEAGHYHHPSYMMTAKKIGVISGSLAGTSGYEWWRGYNPIIGTTIVHLGGNRPPVIEFLTPEFLYGYKCKGAYSDENLAKAGYRTDQNFDPNKHGFGKVIVNGNQMPQNAIQKRLWDIVEDRLWGLHNRPLI